MRYYRCKCGKSEAWGSMSPPRCEECSTCQTTLETAPSLHRRAEPHQWFESQVQTDEGSKALTRCAWCLKTRQEIEAKQAETRAKEIVCPPPGPERYKLPCRCGQPMGENGHMDVYDRDGVTYVGTVRCAQCEEALGKP